MKTVLLIGAGRFGKNIAMKLHELKSEVMVVDKQEERVEEVRPYVTDAQVGDSMNEAFLRSIGVSNYDVCIVAIGNDFQSSLETSSLLKKLGAKKVVSRAVRDVQAKFLLRNGADEIVYPEKQMAAWTAIKYSSDNIWDYIELGQEYAIFELAVPETWIGRTVEEINIRQKYNINIMALKRNGKMELSITPDTCFGEGQAILVLGNRKDIQKCFHI